MGPHLNRYHFDDIGLPAHLRHPYAQFLPKELMHFAQTLNSILFSGYSDFVFCHSNIKTQRSNLSLILYLTQVEFMKGSEIKR